MTSMHLRLMRQSTLRLRCKKAYVVFIGSRNLNTTRLIDEYTFMTDEAMTPLFTLQ